MYLDTKKTGNMNQMNTKKKQYTIYLKAWEVDEEPEAVLTVSNDHGLPISTNQHPTKDTSNQISSFPPSNTPALA
jgi:hypothetical protein